MWGETIGFVENAAVAALEALNATPQRKRKGSEIYAKACEPDSTYAQSVSENVFKSYLSGLSRNPTSRIVKDAGSHGHYLKKDEPKDLSEAEYPAVPVDAGKQDVEKGGGAKMRNRYTRFWKLGCSPKAIAPRIHRS